HRARGLRSRRARHDPRRDWARAPAEARRSRRRVARAVARARSPGGDGCQAPRQRQRDRARARDLAHSDLPASPAPRDSHRRRRVAVAGGRYTRSFLTVRPGALRGGSYVRAIEENRWLAHCARRGTAGTSIAIAVTTALRRRTAQFRAEAEPIDCRRTTR